MTRYMIIFAAVLIGSVVGNPYYGDDWCLPLAGDPGSDNGHCEYYEDANDDPSNPDVCSDKNSDACKDLTKKCTPGLCREDCHCDGEPCDQKCYFGCQFEDPGLIQPGKSGKGRANYCNKVRDAWLDQNPNANECNGDCGVCAEPWCAQIDVIEGNALTGGSCKRDEQTWIKWDNDLKTHVPHQRVCTKSMVEECDIQTNPYKLLADCDTTCGYPHQCDDGTARTWNPINGNTSFGDLCKAPISNFKLFPGSCEEQLEPPTCRIDDHYPSGTNVMRWNVMRLPPFMCDEDCGMQEARFRWGQCARTHIPGTSLPDHMCFAVTDASGMDIGPCEIQSAGAQVFDCNGKNVCIPEEKEYPQEVVTEYKNVEKIVEVYPEGYNADHKKDPVVYDTMGDSSASTYTVLSVAGIALAHAML